jgi:Macrocin-O-methyltransferase (TylF)
MNSFIPVNHTAHCMNDTLSMYDTVLGKIKRRILDIPWILRDARELLISSEFSRLYPLIRNHTMSSRPRLRALHMAVEYVCQLGIPGDIVECGTARGGSAALLGLTLKKRDRDRCLWVFDTFEGLPAPTNNDPDYDVARQYTGGCFGSIQEVNSFFGEIGILNQVKLVKGLFQQTLKDSHIGTIAVLHLDGDWYDSTMTCLNHLYDRIAPGGVVQIDDYGHWHGARKAVHDFFYERNIHINLKYIDYTGRQLIKS